MAVIVPNSHLDLLTQPIFVSAVTIIPDGTPQASIVWRIWEEPYILVSSPRHTQKTRNVTREPRITFLMVDPQNPYRYLEIGGVVTAVLPDPDYDFLERITQFYQKRPFYGAAEPIENRGKKDHMIFRIEPQKLNFHS